MDQSFPSLPKRPLHDPEIREQFRREVVGQEFLRRDLRTYDQHFFNSATEYYAKDADVAKSNGKRQYKKCIDYLRIQINSTACATKRKELMKAL